MDEFIKYSLTRSINAKLRRQFLQHFPEPKKLRALLASSIPTINTNDALFNQSALAALRERESVIVKEAFENAIRWRQLGQRRQILGLDHPNYPRPLLETTNPPPVLYVNGDLSCLNSPCVAIVGARKASHNALEQARQIAHELAESGITIVSGLALGIDAAAHQGAIHGAGQTIAVAATGPERVYPRSHQQLAVDVQNNGAVITEFAVGSSLQPHCFPRRNRIISGISLGVLVVEAALPSGTLTTAQHALRQGREVMAMPGSVHNPLTRGCHELIKSGAALVENTQDVLVCLRRELERELVPEKSISENKLNKMEPDTLTLLDCLGFDPVSIDTLVRRSGLDAARVSGALTHLEISGVIVTDHGGRYVRCKQTGKNEVVS